MLPTLYMVFIIQLELSILLVYVLASRIIFVCTSSITISETLLPVLVPVGSLKLSHTTYYIALTTRSLDLSSLLNSERLLGLLTLTSSSYTCNLLLFGNPNYNFYTNEKILEITICFITTSKRFLVPLINLIIKSPLFFFFLNAYLFHHPYFYVHIISEGRGFYIFFSRLLVPCINEF